MDTEKLENIKQLLKVCRIKILNIRALRLFGCILYKFDIILTDDDLNYRTASCTIKNNRPTLIFNINFVSKLQNFKEFLFLLLHEMLHFINNHLTRGLDKNPPIYNLAGDHVINKMLLADSESSLKDHISDPQYAPALVFDEIIHNNWTTDEVYVWLMDNKIAFISFDESTNEIIVENPGGAKTIIADLDPNTIKNNDDTQKVEELVKEIRAELRAAIDNNLIGKGSESSKVFEFIDELTRVEIPWDQLIENCINSTITISPDNRSWKYINKRMAYYDHLMPSKGTIEKKDNLYLIMDTSASISKENLSKFCYIIEGCLNYFDRIKIIQHDYAITKTLDVKTSEFIEKKDQLFGIYGRGGTSHSQPFKSIEEDYVDNESIGMVLCLTDYESNIEEIWDSFKWKDEIPFKLILTKSHPVKSSIDSNPILIH